MVVGSDPRIFSQFLAGAKPSTSLAERFGEGVKQTQALQGLRAQGQLGGLIRQPGITPQEIIQQAPGIIAQAQPGEALKMIQTQQAAQQKAAAEAKASKQDMLFNLLGTFQESKDEAGANQVLNALKTSMPELAGVTGINFVGDLPSITQQIDLEEGNPLGVAPGSYSIESTFDPGTKKSNLVSVKPIDKEKPTQLKFNKEIGIWNPETGDVITDVKTLGVPTTDPEKQFEQEQKLRTQFFGLTKDFRLIRDSFSRVEVSAIDPTGAGDLALIFNYMKILDPGSVVREGEFATAQNSAGIPERTRALYNRIIDGTKLGPEQRKDFLDRAGKLFKSREVQFNQTQGEYKKLAKAYNLDPERVVIALGRVDPLPKKEEEKPPPSVINIEQQIQSLRNKGVPEEDISAWREAKGF